RERRAMMRRSAAVPFNPQPLQRPQAAAIACRYGDISTAETLRHAGIERAAIIVSSISDWLLQGTDDFRLLRQARSLAPAARVIVPADTLPTAERLYVEGADYVLIPPALAAEHLYRLLLHPNAEALAEARRQQAAALLSRPPHGA